MVALFFSVYGGVASTISGRMNFFDSGVSKSLDLLSSSNLLAASWIEKEIFPYFGQRRSTAIVYKLEVINTKKNTLLFAKMQRPQEIMPKIVRL
jgi:hypothetical protein